MSTAGLDGAGTSPRAAGLFEAWRRREPTLAAFALLMVAATVPTLIAMALDVRTFNGINVWIKPFKFQASVAIYLATVAWFWPYIDAAIRARAAVRARVWALCILLVLEIVYITYRAAMAEGSHFNESTIAAVLYPLMGVAILIAVSIGAWFGVLILRSTEGGISANLRFAIGAGLLAGNILGGVSGAFISSLGSHWIGGVHNDAGGLLFFGWSRTGGDPRVAHFIGLHAMQAIPVIGYVVQRLAAGRAIIWASLLLWTAVTAAVFMQALAGRPLLPP
jgi:hypothetical protein